jgi:cystathionine beta-lyase
VKTVYYSGLESHPHHEIANKQMSLRRDGIPLTFTSEKKKMLFHSWKIKDLHTLLNRGGVESCKSSGINDTCSILKRND